MTPLMMRCASATVSSLAPGSQLPLKTVRTRYSLWRPSLPPSPQNSASFDRKSRKKKTVISRSTRIATIMPRTLAVKETSPPVRRRRMPASSRWADSSCMIRLI